MPWSLGLNRTVSHPVGPVQTPGRCVGIPHQVHGVQGLVPPVAAGLGRTGSQGRVPGRSGRSAGSVGRTVGVGAGTQGWGGHARRDPGLAQVGGLPTSVRLGVCVQKVLRCGLACVAREPSTSEASSEAQASLVSVRHGSSLLRAHGRDFPVQV